MRTIRLVLSGKVQGVGFRYHAAQKAAKYDIRGYAKNHANTVEIVAQSAILKNLETFIRECRRGPLLSKIESAKQEDVPDSPAYSRFDVK